MKLEAGKYYILDNDNELVTDTAYDTRDAAIAAAQEIADQTDRDDVFYVCPTEQQENVEFMCAVYVIRVNDGDDATGCYDFNAVYVIRVNDGDDATGCYDFNEER